MRPLTLLYQTHSPYARKVLVFAHETGLADSLEVVHHETSPTLRNEAVYAHNPLGQVPVLLRPQAPPLFDSDVICAYLDMLHTSRKLIPAAGEARWRALRQQAVAQGMCEAGIAYRWETVRRPQALRYAPLADAYAHKLHAAYDWLEQDIDPGEALHIGHIAIATALSWLAFRGLPDFRVASDGTPRPRLTSWLDGFACRASMQATPLSGQTHDA